MEKISVSVRVPALDNTYDFIVPSNMAVRDVEQLMMKILSSEYGISESVADLTLFDREDATVLRMECSLSQLGIGDGAKLVLM
ncbi:MAG: hypothetical protein IKN12_07140 [Selenomonadaceae bacterium]|nr:hypothetical protein [Selenomonadaceae bacterium]